MDIEDTVCHDVDWNHVAQERNKWLAAVNMECTFGFYKMKGISCLAEKLVVGLCCMELISYNSCGGRPQMHLQMPHDTLFETYQLVFQFRHNNLMLTKCDVRNSVLPKNKINDTNTDKCCSMMEIRSEKCVVRRFRHFVNVYLHKPRWYSIAYCTPRLYGIAYCS